MTNALTCWKEIARYLGKGVRTVQRWEREMGLPVRRPRGGGTGPVLAIPEELDAWLLSQPYRNPDDLSARPMQLSPTVAEQCSRLFHASMSTWLDCAESIDMSRNLRALRWLQRNAANNRVPFEPQLESLLRLCTIAEDDLTFGRLDATRNLIQKIRRLFESVHVRTDIAHLSDSNAHSVRERLEKLQTRILSIESSLSAIPALSRLFTPASELNAVVMQIASIRLSRQPHLLSSTPLPSAGSLRPRFRI